MRIVWNEQAKLQIENIFKFNQAIFGTPKAIQVIQSIKQHISLLKLFPQMGSIEQNIVSEIYPYRYLIKKHCKIYYTIESDYIYIMLIWDTRQDPEKLRIHLK